MNIPTPLPDEYVRGYLGRIKRLNGDLPLGKVRRMLMNVLSNASELDYSDDWVPILAKISGLGMETFIRRHTFLPFSRAVHTKLAGIAHGSPDSERILNSVKMTSPVKCARFCKECIRVDQLSSDIGYWRRSHQLPGAVYCSEHGSALYHADERSPERGLPNDFEESAVPVANEIILAAKNNPLVARYVSICHQLLDGNHPIGPEQAATRLAERATLFDLRLYALGVKKNLSDLVILKLAGPWLEEFFPCLNGKRPGEYVAKIDGTCISKHTPYHASAYALALAVLWDSPDEAIEQFRRPICPLEPKKYSKNFRRTSAAKSYFINSSNKDSDGKKHQSLESAMELFSSGASLMEASEKSGLLPKELEDVLRNILACEYA
jgi:hypothetical protein